MALVAMPMILGGDHVILAPSGPYGLRKMSLDLQFFRWAMTRAFPACAELQCVWPIGPQACLNAYCSTGSPGRPVDPDRT